MKIIVFGGDGFCGWPTSLRLSRDGHEVLIIDNLSRRKIDNKLGLRSLVKIKSISKRVKTWNKINKKKIKFLKIDVSKHYKKLEKAFVKFKPNAVVFFSEQRSAPYSMKNIHTMNYTIENNLLGNNNVLYLIAKYNKNCHFIHLGTMGVYGYEFSEKLVPEGYYNSKLYYNKSKYIKKKILHPADPGSIYHMTKAQDELLFQLYNKLYKLKITDLHQGVVWGFSTNETNLHPDLINRIDYDGDYGTVLNRFFMQSIIGHPLTIYGTGGQVRPFINIQNTADCISLAIQNPPKKNRVRILNQLCETKKIKDLALQISKMTKTKYKSFKNPRIEKENNSLIAKPIGLLNMGLNLIKISNEKLQEEYNFLKMNKINFKKKSIIPSSTWKIK